MPADWTGPGLVTSRDDLKQALDRINNSDRAGTSALAHAVQTGDQTQLTPDRSKLLPALPELADILPWPGGLLRGATIAAIDSPSLHLTLLAGAMSEGSYAAAVGQPAFGALAAVVDYRIPAEHLALIPDPGPDWPTVVATLIDGVDMVVVTAPPCTEATVRSLQARARERGCVLVAAQKWPHADLVIERTERRWSGLRQGRGRLRRQYATFTVTGRGRAARPRTWEVQFPPVSLAGPEPPSAEELVAQLGPPPPRAVAPARPAPTEAPKADLWTGLQHQLPGVDRKRR
jgi:hypothetical protein